MHQKRKFFIETKDAYEGKKQNFNVCTKGSLSLKERYIPDKRDKEVTMTRQRIHGMYLL